MLNLTIRLSPSLRERHSHKTLPIRMKGRRWDLISKRLRKFEIKRKLQNVEDLELGNKIIVTVIYQRF